MINKKMMIKQARDGIKRLIKENEPVIAVKIPIPVDNGFVELVDSPDIIPNEDYISCRISHELIGTFNQEYVPTVVSTNLGRYK